MNKLFALYFLISIGVIIHLSCALNRANVCNKVFVKYFSIYGIDVNLDKLYEDGKTWVNDPKYNNFPNRRHR